MTMYLLREVLNGALIHCLHSGVVGEAMQQIEANQTEQYCSDMQWESSPLRQLLASVDLLQFD